MEYTPSDVEYVVVVYCFCFAFPSGTIPDM